MKPVKLIAPLKDYLWGGNRLRTEFGKVSEKDKIAESWELSCHPDGLSVIADGEFAGKTLAEVIESQGTALLGTDCAAFDRFPILVKLIDAKQSLSVQVHPDNEYAMRVEGEPGKTEIWIVLDCEPDAELLYGFRKPIEKEEFRRRIADNTLPEVVNAVRVHPGDMLFIESGTLHAIGAGILIAEIQQNSNSTYRVYDFGRLGADGKPRALHIDKAVDVTRLVPPTRPVTQGKFEQKDGYADALLMSCDYFTVHSLKIETKAQLHCGAESFRFLLCTDGAFTFTCGDTELTLKKGENIFIPADSGDYVLIGRGNVIVTAV